ncbi:MAG TPA: FAD-dependent oxidoreductase [Usitatibacter sp.]|nr:FAD-dependent oxidoreductase [Usitatibacter sp.]
MQEVKLVGRDEVATGTQAFRFTAPAAFEFKPGQAVDLLLPVESDPDARHAFSIASAPHEPELVFATRMRDSPYKRALGALPIGATARLDGPFGSMTLHKDGKRPAILVAGGIGITPFRSMVRQFDHEGAARDVLLIYSNRRRGDAAFYREFEELAARNKRFRMVATMTEEGAGAGESRFIGAQTLQEWSGGLEHPVWYLAGPPAMVEAARKALDAAGVDEMDVRSEEFAGY